MKMTQQKEKDHSASRQYASSFNGSPNAFLSTVLLGVFAINQILITMVSGTMGIKSGMEGMTHIFRVQSANAMEIMMPILNEDGVTTHLQMMPTITELSGDPKSGDAVADGMAVMLAKGTPFYAPEGVSFDDPLGSLSAWGALEQSMSVPQELSERYKYLTNIFPCNFCCGSANQVTVAGHCGCAHAGAARGFLTYMLATYGDTYTNDQLVGEAYRWQALWYPAGVVEDYLLGTGRGDALHHNTHGGAGQDGMHGMTAL
ncbi:MAG: hypothetical protein NUV81_03025 [bacterium]|nr:hypothetical protein [bacterium]